MNAVIYARYSSDNQREESIEGQLRECMEYCKKNGMVVVKEYIDRAFSAKTDHRPDFQRMIKDSAKGLFDVVVVWKLDRFARNRYDSAHYKAALKKNGVRVASAKENIADGPEGIILESMLEGMAEYYSAELSEKVIRGHTENALKCKYNGGTPTFGFQIDADKHYQPDPITAPVVLDIFKMYDTGSTMKEIVDHLNGLGVTTVRGKPADMNFISGILHNRKYIGEYKYRDIVVPDGIPALVPTDLFERVQSKMQKNKKAPARHKAEDDYLLTTKLFCGSCKAMMVGECGTSSSKGQVYHYYRCVNSKRKKTCNAKHKSVRKEPLERAVVSSVMRNIMDDAFVEYFTDQALAVQGQESSELPALRRQLADTEKAIDNLLNAIQAGAFNASVKRRLDEMEETKEKLELSIVKEEIRKPQFTREQIQFYILQFRKVDLNTLEGRRRLIDSFVNSVVVYDDYLLVTFNYKEGAEQITFDQIERSDLSSLGGPRRQDPSGTCRFLFCPGLHCPKRGWCSIQILRGLDLLHKLHITGEYVMSLLKQFTRILLVSLLGEVLHFLLPLPVPASVYGLILMLIFLCTGLIQVEQVRQAAGFLIEIMPVMFIPASVGLTEAWPSLKPVLGPVAATTLLTTVLVMTVTGVVTQFVIRRKKEGQ